MPATSDDMQMMESLATDIVEVLAALPAELGMGVLVAAMKLWLDAKVTRETRRVAWEDVIGVIQRHMLKRYQAETVQ